MKALDLLDRKNLIAKGFSPDELNLVDAVVDVWDHKEMIVARATNADEVNAYIDATINDGYSTFSFAYAKNGVPMHFAKKG